MQMFEIVYEEKMGEKINSKSEWCGGVEKWK